MFGIFKAVTSPVKFGRGMAFALLKMFSDRFELRHTVNATDAGLVLSSRLVDLKPELGDPLADLERDVETKK